MGIDEYFFLDFNNYVDNHLKELVSDTSQKKYLSFVSERLQESSQIRNIKINILSPNIQLAGYDRSGHGPYRYPVSDENGYS